MRSRARAGARRGIVVVLLACTLALLVFALAPGRALADLDPDATLLGPPPDGISVDEGDPDGVVTYAPDGREIGKSPRDAGASQPGQPGAGQGNPNGKAGESEGAHSAPATSAPASHPSSTPSTSGPAQPSPTTSRSVSTDRPGLFSPTSDHWPLLGALILVSVGLLAAWVLRRSFLHDRAREREAEARLDAEIRSNEVAWPDDYSNIDYPEAHPITLPPPLDLPPEAAPELRLPQQGIGGEGFAGPPVTWGAAPEPWDDAAAAAEGWEKAGEPAESLGPGGWEAPTSPDVADPEAPLDAWREAETLAGWDDTAVCATDWDSEQPDPAWTDESSERRSPWEEAAELLACEPEPAPVEEVDTTAWETPPEPGPHTQMMRRITQRGFGYFSDER